MQNVTVTSEEKSNEQTPSRKAMPGKVAFSMESLSPEHIRCAVTAAVIACWAYLVQGGYEVESMVAFLNSDGGSVKYWPFGGMFISLHVLKVAASSGKGDFWLSGFAKTAAACFSGWILVDFLNGDDQRILKDETYLTLAFVVWYLTNHNLPGTNTNVWETAQSMIPKEHIDVDAILDVASLVWTTQAVCDSVKASTSSPSPAIGFSLFTPVIFGLAAGCATKVIHFRDIRECDSTIYRNLLISVYIATDGLHAVPMIGEGVGSVLASVEGYVGGGHTNLCLTAVVFARLFGKFLPLNPLSAITDKVANVLNL